MTWTAAALFIALCFVGCSEDSHNVRRDQCRHSWCATPCERLAAAKRRLDEALEHGGDIPKAQVDFNEARNEYAGCRIHELGYF